MALIPKTAVFQIRVDPDLLVRFQALADHRLVTASELVRTYMQYQVSQHEKNEHEKALKALRDAQRQPRPPESFSLEKSPPDPPRLSGVAKNREQRRLEKKRGF